MKKINNFPLPNMKTAAKYLSSLHAYSKMLTNIKFLTQQNEKNEKKGKKLLK